MARPKDIANGDLVKLTVVHVGTIADLDNDGFRLIQPSGQPLSASFHGAGKFHFEKYQAEPPHRSVVLLRSGFAAQRLDGHHADPRKRWYVVASEVAITWLELNEDEGLAEVLLNANAMSR